MSTTGRRGGGYSRMVLGRIGNFSVSSAYTAKFVGHEVTPTADFTWNCRRRCSAIFSYGRPQEIGVGHPIDWQEGGMPHQDLCPLCHQEDETINHIMLGCVFERTI